MKWIKNKYPKTRADKGYWLTWHNGEPAMFTEEQLQTALIRAKQNSEDTHCSWFQKILNKIL